MEQNNNRKRFNRFGENRNNGNRSGNRTTGGNHSRYQNHDSRRSNYGRRGGNRFRNNCNNRVSKIDESKLIQKAMPIEAQTPYKPRISFSELEIDSVLKRNIKSKGFTIPTPIQDQAIPHILQGKDLLGIANTGTGKTAAFLIPLIQKVIKDRNKKVLIITPTRELAEQINDELYLLTKDLRIFSVECIGGSNIQFQIKNIRRGFQFIVGTPGRLKDLLERRVYNLSEFSTVVLDEVDRMLDMGFVDEIKFLISLLPAERQSLFFSATVDFKVEKIMKMILKPDYVRVYVKTGETAQNVNQDIVRVTGREDKIAKLESLLKDEKFNKVLVFVNTKAEVDRLNDHLRDIGLRVESIHGDRRQRERKRAIENFKGGKAKVLIATDVAARGLDISNVTHVINYDMPIDYEAYVHRIGRTGRANKMGEALTFVGR